jgi:hypothetical protein
MFSRKARRGRKGTRKMSTRIDDITDALREVADDVTKAFGPLSAEQLNWKPSENGWSVGQCFDHLIRTNLAFFDDFDQVAAGTRKSSLWEKASPFTGFWGRFLIRANENDSKKIKAPSKAIVPPSDVDAEVIGRYADNIEQAIAKVRSTVSADAKKVVLTSPFLRVVTYTLEDYYSVMVGHNKKHFRQAVRVAESQGFPKAEAEIRDPNSQEGFTV